MSIKPHWCQRLPHFSPRLCSFCHFNLRIHQSCSSFPFFLGTRVSTWLFLWIRYCLFFFFTRDSVALSQTEYQESSLLVKQGALMSVGPGFWLTLVTSYECGIVIDKHGTLGRPGFTASNHIWGKVCLRVHDNEHGILDLGDAETFRD